MGNRKEKLIEKIIEEIINQIIALGKQKNLRQCIESVEA